MCQFNFIIVQHSGAAADYLESLGYYCFCSLQHGYDAYSWGRTECCNCGSMVGSYSCKLKEKGKYPNQLQDCDYKQAVQEDIAFFENAKERQMEKNFAVEAEQYQKEFEKYSQRLNELFRERMPKCEKFIVYDRSELEPAPPGEEEIILRKKLDELVQKDFVLSYAVQTPPEIVMQMLTEIKSSNYNMHEFRYYRRIFSRLLKLEPCIYFTHVWSEPGELNLVNTLTLDQLRIGDLALLAQDDVIKICQKDTGVS